MASLAETMMNSALKTLDFSKLLDAPQVKEALAIARQIASDFAEIKKGQGDINCRLDNLEREMRLLRCHDVSNHTMLPFPELKVSENVE